MLDKMRRRSSTSLTLPTVQPAARNASSTSSLPQRRGLARGLSEELGCFALNQVFTQITFTMGQTEEHARMRSMQLTLAWREFAEFSRGPKPCLPLHEAAIPGTFVGNFNLRSMLVCAFASRTIEEAAFYYHQCAAQLGNELPYRVSQTPFPAGPQNSFTGLSFTHRHPLGEATAQARSGKKVVLGMVASATQVGGSTFIMDTEETVEKEVCCCTTLYMQQLEAILEARSAGGVLGDYLPEDGVLVCPHTAVLRETAEHAFAPLEVPERLAAVALFALPNHSVTTPCRGPSVPWEERESLSLKYITLRMQMLVLAASTLNADVLVVSPAGIREYGHNPFILGTLFRTILEECVLKNIPAVVVADLGRFKKGCLSNSRRARA